MAWIIDLDGTLALRGNRGPYDWDHVGEDAPHKPIIQIVRALFSTGTQGIYVTGRMDVGSCRWQTVLWLHEHVCLPYVKGGGDGGTVTHWCDYPLHMRPDGDYRPDDVLKHEIYDKHIRDLYTIEGVLDDRDKVVAMWRAIGLSCIQVAPGNF